MTDKDKTKEETLKELLELREQNQDLHQMLKGMAQAAD